MRNSFHFPSLCMRTPETQFVLMAIFHPSSPEWCYFELSLSTFLFNLVSETNTEIIESLCENSSVIVCPNNKLSNLDYVDEVVLLSKSSGKLQVFLDHTKNRVGMLGICFIPSKWKMVPNDCAGFKVELCSCMRRVWAKWESFLS